MADKAADPEEGSLQRAEPLISHPVYLFLSGQTPVPLLMHVDQHSNFVMKRSILMGHGALQSSIHLWLTLAWIALLNLPGLNFS